MTEITSSALLTKILGLDQPLSVTDQTQLLALLQSAAEKIDHEIKNSRHRR